MNVYLELPTLLKETSISIFLLQKSTQRIEWCFIVLTTVVVAKTVSELLFQSKRK